MPTTDRHHQDLLISGEEAARLLQIPVAGIGALVNAGALRFYRGITFLRADVERLGREQPSVIASVQAALRPPAPPRPATRITFSHDNEPESP